MKLYLKNPYRSIKALDACELPDFAVLIGRNGVGKTQILNGIVERAINAPVNGPDDIEKYDSSNFRSGPTQRSSFGAELFAELTAQQYLDGTGGTSPAERAKDIFQAVIHDHNLKSGTEDRRTFDSQLDLAIDVPDFHHFGRVSVQGPPQHVADALETYSRQVAEKILQPLRRKKGQNRQKHAYNHDSALLLAMAMKLSKKLPHQINREDILRAAHYEGDTIGNNISRVYTRYKAEQYSWSVTESERGRCDVRTLMNEYRENNIPPWVTLREILHEMRDSAGGVDVFNFDFTDPELDRINHARHQQYSFQAEMINRTTGESYDVHELSSGETVLMALCMAWFNQDMGRRRPKLILLDELDALLHPSMVRALVSCLKNLFVSNGTRVLMATHCAATVAALEESEIFRVSRNGSTVRIRAVNRTEAVEELSDGIATLDTGLRIAATAAAPVTIISEGNNALHLKRWANIFFPNDVHVYDQLTNHTSAQDLRSYARILANMNPESHLLFVWDCDQRSKSKGLLAELPRDGKVEGFVLRTEDNPLAPSGIENKYSEDILTPYLTETREISTGNVIARQFDGRKKKRFARHIERNGEQTHFARFDDLHEVVSRLVKRAATRQ